MHEPPPLPELECDVVLKGGITSGVVYPRALVRFAATYRLRRLGGSSAGAIGAAFGAAAEHARGHPGAGFEALERVPDELGEGRLAGLFQPTRATRPLLGLGLALSGHDRPGPPRTAAARAATAAVALVRGWPLATLFGCLPGLLGLALAVHVGWWAGVGVGVLAALVLVVGAAAGALTGAARTLTRDVPANLFGLCTGLGRGDDGPGFTDWLSQRVNTLAGRRADDPLLFGHLWTGTGDAASVPMDDRAVDLRVISTCLTQGRPYEMPWEARSFFYEPDVWRRLFPAEVMDALEAAPTAGPSGASDAAEWAWYDEQAARRPRPLRRLPAPEHLPVVVAVRLSISFPVLISAVPLWTPDRRSRRTHEGLAALRAGGARGGCDFVELWFTDGGFTRNFPVHLFDDPLPVRPTFAVNLGSFVTGREPSPDEWENIEYAHTNAALPPSHRPVPASGWAAITGFLGAAWATSREWADASELAAPGMRDRVVRVLQAPDEGGLNLFMDSATLARLAARGDAAASALTEQFTQPRYAGGATGWDNHRWVRYRALLAALPAWLKGLAAGRRAMADLDPADPPSYRLSAAGRAVATELDAARAEAERIVTDPANEDGVQDLMRAPRPRTVLRRTPQV